MGEDKRLLQLVTKEATLIFRARSSQERHSWLLAIVRQAALIKERDILLQAERTIASMETKRSTKQLSELDTFKQLEGVLSNSEAREVFLEFVRRDHAASLEEGRGCSETPRWPDGLELEDVLTCLDQRDGSSNSSAAWSFAESRLFSTFQQHPIAQFRLCRVAAGIT